MGVRGCSSEMLVQYNEQNPPMTAQLLTSESSGISPAIPVLKKQSRAQSCVRLTLALVLFGVFLHGPIWFDQTAGREELYKMVEGLLMVSSHEFRTFLLLLPLLLLIVSFILEGIYVSSQHRRAGWAIWSGITARIAMVLLITAAGLYYLLNFLAFLVGGFWGGGGNLSLPGYGFFGLAGSLLVLGARLPRRRVRHQEGFQVVMPNAQVIHQPSSAVPLSPPRD